jgi:DNA-binding transcriptional MocR family regulator
MTRYESLAAELAALIEGGTFRPGERLPSTRELARSHRASAATVTSAFNVLEDRGLIRARPRSGYYVTANWREAATPAEASPPPAAATEVDVSELVFQVLGEIRKRNVVPLGSAFPSPMLFPLPALALALSRSARRMDPWKTVEDLSPGSAELRRQVAKRYASHGVRIPATEIVVTSGALEALNLCLAAVTRPGDVVAIESPAFYGALQAVERLGLRAVEIETHPEEGVDLGALDRAIRGEAVKACWFMPSLQNPLGASMPEAKKRELVRLLARHGIPLVEDDVYAELQYGSAPTRPAKAFDDKGLVLHCSSFSKSLAPGYRVGWCAPGRFREKVERAKLMTSIATSIPAQEGIAEFLKRGSYDRHLRGLRESFRRNQVRMVAAIARHFPDGTRVTRPSGGYFVWVEMPAGCDAMALHRAALARGISVAPGPIFSPRERFGHCLRLNHGHPWDERTAKAIATLGRLAGG